MKKGCFLFFLFFIFYFSIFYPLQTEAKEDLKNYIILTKDNESLNEIILSSKYKFIDLKTFELVDSFSAYLSDETVDLLKANPSVLSIEENKEVFVDGTLVDNKTIKSNNFNRELTDWGIQKVKADLSWSESTTGKGVKIAVLDTGISKYHSDLNVKGGKSFIPYVHSFDDDNGHGTHVTGIIGAQHNGFGVKGVAPDAEIYGLKVLRKDGTGELTFVLEAIEWSIKNNIDIINMSLSFEGQSDILNTFISKAIDKGILFVASAGNDGGAVQTPANHPSVIAVSSINSQNRISDFSSRGKEINVTAPGEIIASTYINNTYAYMSGTSMAAPYVTGILSLYKEKYPTHSNNQIKSMLYKNTLDLGNKGFDTHYGDGLVQAPYSKELLLPDAPKGLKAEPLNQVVDLSWDEDPSDFLGFNVYVNGKKHNKNLIESNKYRVTNLKNFTSYSFEITSVSKDGTESKKSSKVYATPIFIENDLPGNFKDVPSNHWALGSITFVDQMDWMNGTSSYRFNPEGHVSRAQAAAILVRVLNLKPLEEPFDITFTDVPATHWAYNDIKTAVQHKLFSGYPGGRFDPNGNIKREHMAVVLSRAFFKNYSKPLTKESFTDVPKTRSTYRSILIMKQENILGGYGDGSFKPQNPTTRAQMAAIMQRIYTKIQ